MSELNPNSQDYQDTPVPSEEESNNAKTQELIEESVEAKTVAEAEKKEPKKKIAFATELLDYLEVFVIAICVVILLFSFCFRLCRVSGSSMENTLFHDEALIVSDLFYTPQREDIIVFHQTGKLNEPVVKRVIATEGETVHIRHSYNTMIVTVTDVNGNKTVLEEDYMNYEGMPLYLNDMEYTVPEGQLFVMGDNRNDSKDSRHPDIGLVDERRILGKVLFRITPLSRFGTVN